MNPRKYNCPDVDMLVASNVVLQNFDEYKTQLIAKRKTWADPFASNLGNKISNALDILGINTKTEQTTSTRRLVRRQNEGLDGLTTVKIQIEVDFEDDPDTLKLMLDKLGFSRFYSDAKKGDQEAMIQLLTAFKTNMTPELRRKIEDAGMDGAIIDELINMRDEINEMNVRQEKLKGSSPKETALNIAELNAIYKEVIGICKIAPRLLNDVPTATEDFSFARILSRLN
jgi:hypothetical protein